LVPRFEASAAFKQLCDTLRTPAKPHTRSNEHSKADPIMPRFDRRIGSYSRAVITPLILFCVCCLLCGPVVGEEASPPPAAPPEPTASSVLGDVDVLWTCIAAFLVFFMQAGFALVETGFTRAKNACNILMKNLMDFAIGTPVYWLVGFGLMFGATSSGWFGTDAFVFDAATHAEPVGKSEAFGWAFLIFQTVFCATAATIVSGAMAERTRFSSYLVYSAAISLLIYPLFGKWAWGGLWGGEATKGWLEKMGFLDFAGSTVVHSVGGWCALAGAIMVGPRLGKYLKDGKIRPIPGHSIPLAALGVFVLWLGWFGFNPGSTTAVGGGSFAKIAVTTNVAACMGAIGALLISWMLFKKPDVSFTFNGALAGLVAITAGCNVLSVPYAALTGLMGGVLVVLAVMFFDRIRIDDPVGAISVHGVCGAFGTLATGLFAKDVGLVYSGSMDQVVTQLIGIGTAFVWAFPSALLLFAALKATIGLRVTEAEEIEGLDYCEHAAHAYPPAWVSADDYAGSPILRPSPAPGYGMAIAPATADATS
jgi:Amt family ammonium transporter